MLKKWFRRLFQKKQPLLTPDAIDVERETLPITAIGNVQGIGSRTEQQDAFGISHIADRNTVRERGLLAIVADGMGGLKNSGVISHNIVQSALKAFSSASGSQRETLLMLGSQVHSVAVNSERGSGTTFLAASVHSNMLDFISIGDSRIALYRAGSLLPLNRAHNYAADLESSAARGLMSVAGAMNDPQRSKLTSYVSVSGPSAVDMPVYPMKLCPGDRVILMTDGVFSTLSDEVLCEVLQLGAVEAGQEIERRIRKAAKPDQDNYTAIILEI